MGKFARVLSFFIIFCMAFVGCGKQQKSEEEIKAEIASLQAELGDQEKTSTGEDGVEEAVKDDESGEADSSEEDLDFTSFESGETVKTDVIEFKVDKIGKTSKITQSDTSGYITHYFEADNGKTFVYLYGDIKNVGKQSARSDAMYIEYVFDSGYEYRGQIELEKDGEFDTLGYLDPLESSKFYIFTDIPNDLIDTGEVVSIKISFNDLQDNPYSLNGTEKNRYVIRTKV